MIEVMNFRGSAPGPKLLMTGGVHGDEPAGTVALKRLASELERGEVKLLKGSLTLIPAANPEAGKANARYLEENLNRVMLRHVAPRNYEQKLANLICDQIDAVDIVLDLHAATAPTVPFSFMEIDTPDYRAWFDAVQAHYIITGWAALYKGRNEFGSMESYSHAHGKMAICAECGQKTNPASADEAYRMARATLAHFGMTEGIARTKVTPKYVHITEVEFMRMAGELEHAFLNFEELKAGQLIGRYEDGVEMRSPGDGIIVMPRINCPPGDEWYYFATAES